MNIRKNKVWKILMLTLALVLSCSITSSAAQLSKKTISILAGKTQSLKVKGVTGKAVWSSSNPSVVKVSAAGKISGVKKGTATVKAVINTKTYTCKVSVKQPVRGVGLNKSRYYLMAGKTVRLIAAVSPKTADNKTIAWSTSNKKVANVNSKGLVTAGENGTAIITAKAKDGSGRKAVCKITVLGNKKKTSAASSSSSTSSQKGSSSAAPSTKAQRILKHMEEYSKQAQKDAAAGNPWQYQNSKESKIFSEAVRDKNRRANCALIAVWVLKESDIGVLSYKDKVWGEPYGVIHYGGSDPKGAEARIKSKCDIIKVDAKPSQAYAQGKLKPGDICIYNMGSTGHTNVFAGYNQKTGKFIWYDTGRNSVGGSYSNGTYYFKTFGPLEMSYDNTIAWVIRVK